MQLFVRQQDRKTEKYHLSRKKHQYCTRPNKKSCFMNSKRARQQDSKEDKKMKR